VSRVDDVTAWEVLDSRGNPTVRVAVESGGERGVFTVPAGASTGTHEAVERRDGGDRYRGRGVTDAVAAVTDEIAPRVEGRDVFDQRGLDAALEALDGTRSLSRLGANAVLGVSGAALRTASACAGQPLYRHLVTEYGDGTGEEGRLPVPMINVISGGLHARGGIEIQDVLVIPHGRDSMRGCLEVAWDVRQAVRDWLLDEGHRPLVADEGGFAPPLDGIDEAFELLVDAIETAGYAPGEECSLAVDVAATHFYDAEAERYEIESLGRSFTPEAFGDLVVRWTEAFPLVSVEDPLAEDDWAGWRRLRERIGDGVQVLGDDLLVTDVDRLDRAIDAGAANAVLVKPNQAGTVTRAVDVVHRALDRDVAPVVSARSGETCDATIADLAVGLGAGQIKIGSLARSERLAKYNRLLEIERFGDPEPPSVSAAAFGPE
jgi:enolase